MSRRRPLPRRSRGAALLMAMVIVTLVASLSAAMMWRQWHAVQVEAAQRSRVQSAWMLAGALDWARLILREDARNGGPDHLGEPWAVPLAEARLSTFLALDRESADTSDAPDAFLSGAISDLQARFNLANLTTAEGAPSVADLAVFRRLCENLGVESGVAERLAAELVRANPRASAQETGATEAAGRGDAPLLPPTVADLGWLGLDAATLAKLAPHVTLLPERTSINVNTASREVIAAAIEGLDLASAERLVQYRQRTPFRSVAEVASQLGGGLQLDEQRINVTSNFFEVQGRMRIQERVVEERSMVRRQGREVVALRRERVSLVEEEGNRPSP